MKNLEVRVAKKDEQIRKAAEQSADAMAALLKGSHDQLEAAQRGHETEKGEMKAQVADTERDLALRTKELEKARARLEAWRAQLGVEGDRDLPSVASGDARSTFQSHRSAIKNFSRQKKFVESVLKERNPEVIASAIARGRHY